ncbi:MAG: serine/threonine protein kinase [Cyanobacteria bacterium RYN_339]|nr:serine/threonine protein kinase [Cyanobacteria bacterium RYN_339]
MPHDVIQNRYRVVGVLGEGAMGRVHLVDDLSTGRRQALKALADASAVTPTALLQFKQEFHLMTQLRHPHCCEVYEYGVMDDGRPFFTMEWVEGDDLTALIPLGSTRAREVIGQLLLALDAVHQLGLVHRDLKPENVRVRADGAVKLMDFGLMEHAGRSDAPIKGTLAYLAPEAIKRGPIDLRADLYAVGCLAYELVVGQPPFPGDRPIDILRDHVSREPAPPSWHGVAVDPDFERVIMKLLAKDPLDRYQGAFQVLDDLGFQAPARLGGTLLTSPLMGRDAELALLQGALQRLAEGGPGRATFLYGGSGVGKSRLLEEFRFRAMLENLPIVVGRPYEQGNAPFGLLAQVLRALIPTAPAEALAQAAPVLSRLLPELGVPGGPDLDPASERLRLQAAVAELLRAIAAQRPLVLVLDDWQWADAQSLELWQVVMTQLAGAPIGFVLASRYAPEGAPAWMAKLTAHQLRQLDADGVARMVTSMLGSQHVEPAFIHRVADLSDGNPFFVERLLEHLVQTGAIRIERGVWHTDVTLGARTVPPTLQAILVDKLALLDGAAQRVARVAAVRGRELDLVFLQHVGGLSDDELFQALDDLIARRVFQALEGGVYRFAQDHFHEFLYAHLTGPERQALHQDVARALAAMLADQPLADAPFEVLTDAAHHAIAADDGPRAIAYALEAARRHARLYALAPAERLLKSGLGFLKQGEPDPTVLTAYLVALGDVRRMLGNYPGAKQAYVQALPHLQGDLATGRALAALGNVHRMLGSWSEAFGACERALPLLLAAGAEAEAAEALMTTSRAYHLQGDVPQALVEAERALKLARSAGERRCIAQALAHLGHLVITYDPARYQEGMAHLNETLAILPGLGDKSGLRDAYLVLGNAQYTLGDYAAARIGFAKSLALSEEINTPSGAVAALVNLGLVALEQGEFGMAIAHAKDAYDRALRVQHTYLIGASMVVEAVAGAYRGQMAAAQPLLRRVLELARDIKNAFLETLALQWLLEVQAHCGDLDAAVETGAVLAALVARTGETEPACRLHAQLAEIHARRGEIDAAVAASDAALAAAARCHADGGQVRALKARARVAIAAEHWAAAQRAAEKALGIAQRIGAEQQAAELHGILGEVALATGMAAEVHFQWMERLAESIGLEPLLAEALFGLAAARPYHEAAASLVVRARELLERQAGDLDPAARERFFALAERERVLAGNAIEYSLPRAVQRHTGSLLERLQGL